MLLTLVALMGACSSAVTVTDSDDGGSVQLAVGDELDVALSANPSTGYDWYVTAVDRAVLEQSADPTFEAESDLAGAEGTVHLRFTAVGEGSTALELVYERSFEDAPPLDTYRIEVAVS